MIRAQLASGCVSHWDLTDQCKIGRHRVACAKRIAGSDGIAVNRCPLELRKWMRRNNVLREDAAERGSNVNRLRINDRRRKMREQEFSRFVGRKKSQKLGHCLIEAKRSGLKNRR